jgi:arylsulfatase A-like enzyme
VVSSSVVLNPALGLDRGFDTYEVVEPSQLPASGEGAVATRVARAWLREHGGPGSFLWVHYFDAHLPYLPPAPLDRLYAPRYAGPFRELPDTHEIQATFANEMLVTPADVEYLRSLYAGEVTFLDLCVGRLIWETQLAPGGENTLILVTADHGEGLHEHARYFGHDTQLYESSLKVPLLLAGAPPVAAWVKRGRPRLVREAARTLDVTPTLLGLTGREPGGPLEGRDLLRDPPPSGEGTLFVAETHPSRRKSTPLYAIRTDEHKVIWEPRKRRWEYYDLVGDPGERSDLFVKEGLHPYTVLGEDLEIDLRMRPVGRVQTLDEEAGGPSAETLEALRSLGYVD